MTIGQIGFTRVKVHPGLFLVLAGAVILGLLGELLQAFLALTMHESFHAIAAHMLGYRIESVELLPFGGVARMQGGQFASPRAEFCIAMAGPVCNFIVAGAAAIAVRGLPALEYHLQYFITANLALALFNLLPALPLDGGRMLRAILLRAMRPRAATLLTAWLGVACAAVLLGLSVLMLLEHAFNPFLLIMGVFLALGALRELRTAPEAQLASMLRRRDAVARGEALPARTLAVRGDTGAMEAARMLKASQYTVLLVLDQDMQVIGQLDEGRLLAGMAKHGRQVRVGKLI